MGSRVLTACSFRSKSNPKQVFHRCRSAEALRLFRVPAVYLTSAFLWFFSILLFRRINNLRRINPPEGFDSHPGHQSMSKKKLILIAIAAVVIGLPVGWILAMSLTPVLWKLDPLLHLELAGHSGPS